VDVKAAVTSLTEAEIRALSTQEQLTASQRALRYLPDPSAGPAVPASPIAEKAMLFLGMLAYVNIEVLSEKSRVALTQALVSTVRSNAQSKGAAADVLARCYKQLHKQCSLRDIFVSMLWSNTSSPSAATGVSSGLAATPQLLDGDTVEATASVRGVSPFFLAV
jgi:hypothetical protein